MLSRPEVPDQERHVRRADARYS